MGVSRNPASRDSIRTTPVYGSDASTRCTVCGRPANDPFRNTPYGCIARVHDAFLARGTPSYRFAKAAVARLNVAHKPRLDGFRGH